MHLPTIMVVLALLLFVQFVMLFIVHVSRRRQNEEVRLSLISSGVLALSLFLYFFTATGTFNLGFISMILGNWALLFVVKAVGKLYNDSTIRYKTALIITAVELVILVVFTIYDVYVVRSIISMLVNVCLSIVILKILLNQKDVYKIPLLYEISLFLLITISRIAFLITNVSTTANELPDFISIIFTLGVYCIVLMTLSIVVVITQRDFELLSNAKQTIEHSFTKVKELSETDQLTNLYNRRKIIDIIDSFIKNAKDFDFEFSVLLGDINGFKNINDTYGHNVGDDVLIFFSEFLTDTLRVDDIIGRWGGDEFIVILPNTSNESANSVKDKLCKQLEKSRQKIIPEKIRVSIGCATYQENQTQDELIHDADTMMYQHKKAQQKEDKKK